MWWLPRVKKLSISLSHLPELEPEIALLVKDLDPVIVGVSHNNLVILGNGHTARLSKLTLENAKLSKLAVVDHLLAPNLSVHDRGRGHRSGQRGGGAHS